MSGRRKPVEVYVSATGNAFMTDIANWFVEAARLDGRPADLVTDRLPHDPDVINLVVAPHEFFGLWPAADAVINQAAAVSIPLCTEQPGTPWFQVSASYCRPAALTLDINPHGVAALRHLGITAERVDLGAVPSMTAPVVERSVDVLFLGGDTPRRRRRLATLGPVLADRSAELRLFSFVAPVDGATPGLVFGQDKYQLLARSRILVNVHRDDSQPAYFEWARMVEAMANGATVVTEPSTGHDPLIPGVHFVETDDLAGAVAELLADPVRCATIGEAARRAVTDQRPLAATLGPVLASLDRLDVRPASRSRTARRTVEHNKILRPHTVQLFPPFRPAIEIRERTYHALLAEQKLRREIDAARCQVRYGQTGHLTEHHSPGYLTSFADGHQPAISVVVTLYNYAHLVTETLESIVASEDADFEIVVVDDHSSDNGRAVVLDFMERHPTTPTLLLGREDNHGLAAARNLGVDRARADTLMIMDADNLVYPRCLAALSAALDADPTAAFAYAILESFGTDPGLASHLAWNPAWLCAANYIDAQAMVRRSTYQRYGGYREDDDYVYGWEDWDLWLRLAAAGEHAAFVPQMLGRYRTQESSMISITRLASDILREHIERRYPTLPWP